MSQTSTHLNLPYIQPAQVQKYVTYNDAIELLDLLVHLSVQALGAATRATRANTYTQPPHAPLAARGGGRYARRR